MVSWQRQGHVVGKGEGKGVWWAKACGGQRRVVGKGVWWAKAGRVVGKGKRGGASKGLTRGEVSGWEEE